MQGDYEFNYFISSLFNRILKIEQRSLLTGLDYDVSITEIHILEKIGVGRKVRMSDLAKSLDISLATLTIACEKLSKKELIYRNRDAKDKRIVNISLAPKGIVAYNFHEDFYRNMIDTILKDLSEDEKSILGISLKKLDDYFKLEAKKAFDKG